MSFNYPFSCHVVVLQPQSIDWFGLFRFRSPLLSESLLFSFPPGTKMFQFPGLSSMSYVLAQRWYRITDIRLPHSEIPGSLSVYDSPRRFAVNCVLLLLYMPRHPPYALIRLITPSFDGFLRTVNQVFPFSVQTCLIFVFTTFQKDLSVFLSVIQFSKNNLELPLFQVIPQNRTGISNVGKTSCFVASCTIFSLERRWSIPTFS